MPACGCNGKIETPVAEAPYSASASDGGGAAGGADAPALRSEPSVISRASLRPLLFDSDHTCDCMRIAADYGQTAPLLWLRGHGYTQRLPEERLARTLRSVQSGAAKAGHLCVLQWCRSAGYILTEDACDNAAEGGHLSLFAVVAQRGLSLVQADGEPELPLQLAAHVCLRGRSATVQRLKTTLCVTRRVRAVSPQWTSWWTAMPAAAFRI